MWGSPLRMLAGVVWVCQIWRLVPFGKSRTRLPIQETVEFHFRSTIEASKSGLGSAAAAEEAGIKEGMNTLQRQKRSQAPSMWEERSRMKNVVN